ncbi:MAG TPA: phosphatidate cytidylyltransferase, partial [Acidimicrobiia bacterium]|nr:phosphatidate cytidylyltransferase [Acidimicrobiia bacterium]
MDDETPGPDQDKGQGPSPEEKPDEAEVFTLPLLSEDEDEDGEPSPESPDDSADLGEASSEFIPRNLDDFSSDEYTDSTTQEYQGLAEEVSRAAEEQWEQQAVSALVPGVGSGLVGFEDVTGASLVTEEDYEASEQALTSDLAMRVASALVIFGMFLGSLLLGGWWFTTFVILVMVVGTGEFYATVRSDDYRPLALFGLLGVVFMGLGAHLSGAAAIAGWAAAFALATVLFLSLSPRRQPLEDASVTIGGMAWVGLLSFAILIAAGPQPVAFILFVVLVVAANDIGAFFVGRAFGSHVMAPQISPKKTWEGFFGGLIAGAVAASVVVTFPAWETIGLAKGLVAAALIGLVSPIGDAVESMVKRTLGVKDMGSVLPGHGGILDRIDGFLFAV